MAANAALYIAAGTAAATVYSTQQQAGASKRQYAAEQKKAEIQNIRAQRQQIRSARAAQATMANVAAQTGGMGGSGLAGGTSSVSSQLGGNLDYMGQVAQQNTAIGNAAGDAAQWGSTATIFGAVGSFAGSKAGGELINKIGT